MTFKEIESGQIRIDYVSYLTNSKPLQDIYLKVSAFKLDNSFSIRLTILLEESFFNGFKMSLKEIEQFIKEFERFPKAKVFKSVDEQEYKVLNITRHSTKIWKIKLSLNKAGNMTLEDLPYRIRWVWNDILDRFS